MWDFSQCFFQVLGVLDICCTYGHSVILEFSSGPYTRRNIRENWWLYYFDQNYYNITSRKSTHSHQISEEEAAALSMYGRFLPPAIAFNLIMEMNLLPKKNILNKVSSFASTYFQEPTIGVHYRGTDKASEAPRTDYETVILRMNEFKEGNFFIASDEENFIKSAVDKFGNRVVFCNHIRSNDLSPIHLNANKDSGKKLGEEAIIDCLLLARCQVLIRTASNLSIASSFFNPEIRVIEV